MAMNVWVRISSAVDFPDDAEDNDERTLPEDYAKLKPYLTVTVYASREKAENARQKLGGIVLETSAACLKNIPSEFGTEVILSPRDINEPEGPSEAYISVCFDGLPYKMVPNYGPYEPGTVEPQGDIADFGPEADAWFEALEQETGFNMHQ